MNSPTVRACFSWVMITRFARQCTISLGLLLSLACICHATETEEPKILLKLTGLWGGSVTPAKDARTPGEKANAEVLEAFLKKFPRYGFQPSRTIRLPQGQAAESSLLMAM